MRAGRGEAEVGQPADRAPEAVGDDVLEHVADLRVEGGHRLPGDPVEELVDPAGDLGGDGHGEVAVDRERPGVKDDLVGIARRAGRQARADRRVRHPHAQVARVPHEVGDRGKQQRAAEDAGERREGLGREDPEQDEQTELAEPHEGREERPHRGRADPRGDERAGRGDPEPQPGPAIHPDRGVEALDRDREGDPRPAVVVEGDPELVEHEGVALEGDGELLQLQPHVHEVEGRRRPDVLAEVPVEAQLDRSEALPKHLLAHRRLRHGAEGREARLGGDGRTAATVAIASSTSWGRMTDRHRRAAAAPRRTAVQRRGTRRCGRARRSRPRARRRRAAGRAGGRRPRRLPAPWSRRTARGDRASRRSPICWCPPGRRG